MQIIVNGHFLNLNYVKKKKLMNHH